MSTFVLVTSDTHVAVGSRLPAALLELADRADHVIHAGDLVALDVLATLAVLAPVTAVHGNVDDTPTTVQLPERTAVELDGVTFGVVHDAGPLSGRHERLAEWFPGARVRVYGHSHLPELTKSSDGSWVVNPGSPTQRRRAPTHTAAWFELDAGVVLAADLVHLD